MPCNKLIIPLAALALPACATTQPSMKAGTAGFGEAQAANIAAQAIAPSEAQKADTYIPANRARRALARKAYEDGEVKEPVSPVTTNGGND